MQFGLASLLRLHHSKKYFVDVLELSKSKEKREVITTDQKFDELYNKKKPLLCKHRIS